MKDFWGAMIMGALLGAAVTLLYFNNDREVRRATRQIKAKSKKAMQVLSRMGDEVGHKVGKQGYDVE